MVASLIPIDRVEYMRGGSEGGSNTSSILRRTWLCVWGGGCWGGGGGWSGGAGGCWVRVGRGRGVKWRWRWLNSRSIWDGLRGEALRVGGYVGRVRVRVRVRWWLVHLDGG